MFPILEFTKERGISGMTRQRAKCTNCLLVLRLVGLTELLSMVIPRMVSEEARLDFTAGAQFAITATV
jgi:hypothetical protein